MSSINTTSLPTHRFLKNLNISFQSKSFPSNINHNAASVAQYLGLNLNQVVKELVFEVIDTKEKFMILIPGDKVAISSHLKKIVGSNDIELANKEEIEALSGYELGVIPAFSWQDNKVKVYMDISLFGQNILGVTAGRKGEEILLNPKDLQIVSKAITANLVDINKDAFVIDKVTHEKMFL